MTTTGQQKLRITALALGAMFVTGMIRTPTAQAQTYTVLHRFTHNTGGGILPDAGLIGDSAGNLYGTTSDGGGPSSFGVVFKLDKTGETVLYRFTGGADGLGPAARLVRDPAGNLYGTTSRGGTSGYGVVFKLDTTGTETVLHSFTGGADGAYPGMGGLIRDSAGNLYGTTGFGGNSGCGGSGCGVVFKLDSTGTETVLHRFRGAEGADGANPSGALIADSAGNLYGTTEDGGTVGPCRSDPEPGCGVVFKLDTTHMETVLYSFTGGSDGAQPYAGLIRDSAGNLYGTTENGGLVGCPDGFACGVVFKLDTTGTEAVLYSFTGGADGGNPYAGLIRDSAGNFYGSTGNGGTFGHGVVFKLDTTGTETVLHGFTGGTDGSSPIAGLTRDSAGNLYGTTAAGGSGCQGDGCGVVFRLEP